MKTILIPDLPKETLNISIDDVNEDYIICPSKWKIVKLPLYLTPKLAYFVGYLQGDGCIASNKRTLYFADEYKEQMEMIDTLSLHLFGIRGKVRERRTNFSKKSSFALEIGSKALNSYLTEVFTINRGKKKNLRIPKMILEDKEFLRRYLTGLFDADGTLPKNPETCKQFFIDITLKDKEFIEQIREALRSFGIRTLEPYCRIAKSPNSDFISKTWELRIRKREDMRSFLKKIGFAHPNKSVRVERLLAIMDP